jgi:hypothetical protein
MIISSICDHGTKTVVRISDTPTLITFEAGEIGSCSVSFSDITITHSTESTDLGEKEDWAICFPRLAPISESANNPLIVYLLIPLVAYILWKIFPLNL